MSEQEVDLKYTYYKMNCEKCGRQVLVEIVYEDKLPNMEVHTICGPCLVEKGFNDEFIEGYPEVVKDMNRWLGLESKDEDES